MIVTRTETPLRRSVMMGKHRGISQANITINDDEEERRLARQRHLKQVSVVNNTADTTAFEDNETLKKCMEIYNGNKLSRDNAWNLSLIDTLSNLLDRHHKTLNNFKVAGSSLEASSRVYGLRVDSIYTDVLRMSAGLNAKKFNEAQINDDDDEDDNPNKVNKNNLEDGFSADAEKQNKPKKRVRKAVSTVTKNKDTLNARLDIVPLQDPVFGKLNTVVGSINASNRLMNNILPTKDAELRLRTNYKFWDVSDLPADVDYTSDANGQEYSLDELINADWVVKFHRLEQQLLRPMHSGYIISDTPILTNKDDKIIDLNCNNSSHHDDLDFFHNPKEISMAFDMNAECEPMPAELDPHPSVLEIDYNDLQEMTNDERDILNYCQGIRKTAQVIEDLRPVDANSELEYSYRPMENISQFWAGPSHWKFKRVRPRSTTLSTYATNDQTAGNLQRAARRAQQMQAKRRCKLQFGECHDDIFIPLQKYTKLRKANIQRKWDPRKLKLPTNLKIDKNCFFKYEFAPGIKIQRHCNLLNNIQHDDDDYEDDDNAGDGINDAHDYSNDKHFTDGLADNEDNIVMGLNASISGNNACDLIDSTNNEALDERDTGNETVLEIATVFEGAPKQVTKVIVPFARRAKIIDMKSLKRSCSQLITNQMKIPIEPANVPKHPNVHDEKYTEGVASFSEIYKHLPEVLTPAMTESLSPAVALYSVLHLANELNLRLIPQEDMEDFKIRQVIE